MVIHAAATNNKIGDTGNGEPNFIAYNSGNGVQVGDDTTDNATGNAILGNSIYLNGQLGINLGGETSPSGNSIASSGPNRLQNAPVLSFATTDGSGIKIVGELTASPGALYEIELFSNVDNTAQGEAYLDDLYVETNASGVASFNIILPYSIALGAKITTTATDFER